MVLAFQMNKLRQAFARGQGEHQERKTRNIIVRQANQCLIQYLIYIDAPFKKRKKSQFIGKRTREKEEEEEDWRIIIVRT